VYGIYAVLSAILQFGMKRQVLLRNVARVVDPPKMERPKIAVMARGDLETFLDVIDDVRDRAMFYLFLCTGMRRGELVGLRWEDFDPETGRLTIRRRIMRSKIEKGYDYDEPKTRSGYRVNKLPPPVVEVLERWRERQDLERRCFRTWVEGGWIFTSRQHRLTGRHLDPSSINRLLEGYLETAKLTRVTVHGLRHSFCTWLLQRGVSAKDVQEAVGHSRVSVTLDMYWEATSGSEERIADSVGEIISPKSRADFPEISPKQQSGKRHLRAI
jgi:integrase